MPGEIGSVSKSSSPSYGPAADWKDIFKEVSASVPRVGSVVVEVGNGVFQKIAQVVSEFNVRHVEACRGTERYRLPKSGYDLSTLKDRLTVILNRDTGRVETLGKAEEWQKLPKTQQIRKAKSARLSLTIFGDDIPESSPVNPPAAHGQPAEGDRHVSVLVPPDEKSVPDLDDSEMPSVSQASNPKLEERVMEMGFPPKNIPKHGPKFLELSDEDKAFVRSMHHKMGHPDPIKFAHFLKSAHASMEIVAGSLDFQCDSCVESKKGFSATEQAAIHEDIGFNQVLGMDMAYWTNGRGVKYGFVHFLDEGTLFHQGLPCKEDSRSQIAAFEMSWLTWAGPPKEMYFDPATEYVSAEFLNKLQSLGIAAKVTARDSHWQLGRTEVHGSILKKMLDRMDTEAPINTPEEFHDSLTQAICAKNALSRIRGYTPEQAVLGFQEGFRVP